jgi:hypothetical protein
MDPFGRIQRSLTSELLAGATDGALKKKAPNWSNRIEDATDPARSLLSHTEGGYDWDPVDSSDAQYCHGYVRGA